MSLVFVAHCHVAHNPRIKAQPFENGFDESLVLRPLETNTTYDLMAMAAEELYGKKGISFWPVSLYCYSDGGVRHPKQGSLKVGSIKVSELRAYVKQQRPNDEQCQVHIDLKSNVW